jgi:hypothetical protein
MKTIKNIDILNSHQLSCTFNDGITKIADLSIFLKSPAFMPLQNPEAFKTLVNKIYFIEWADFELDLSADTLWNIGV